MPDDESVRVLPQVARQVASDVANFRIVVVESGYHAGILTGLLLKAFHIPKNQITELGITASDAQIASLLSNRKPIVIVPENILSYRPCRFWPPHGATEVTIVLALGAETKSTREPCSDQSFELHWVSSEHPVRLSGGAAKTSAADTEAEPSNATGRKWWQFWR